MTGENRSENQRDSSGDGTSARPDLSGGSYSIYLSNGTPMMSIPKPVVDHLDLTTDYVVAPSLVRQGMDYLVRLDFEPADQTERRNARALIEHLDDGALYFRYPTKFSKIIGLHDLLYQHKRTGSDTEYTQPSEVQVSVSWTEDGTGIISQFSPALTARIDSGTAHPDLDPELKEFGLNPSSTEEGDRSAVRCTLPVEFAKTYGFERQAPIGLDLVLYQGELAIRVNLDPDIEDTESQVLHKLTWDGRNGVNQYEITLPQDTLAGLEWGVHTPVTLIPQEGQFLITLGEHIE